MSIHTSRGLALLLAIPSAGLAQSLSIDRVTLAAGGGAPMTGATLEMTGTVGQAVSSSVGGASLGLDPGYWSALLGAYGNTITALSAVPGPTMVRLDWTSEGFEPRLTQFQVGRRAAGTTGPFQIMVTENHTGPGDYSTVTRVAANVPTEYQLFGTYQGGGMIPLRSIIATAYPRDVPPGNARVGFGYEPGTYLDIASAIAGATGNSLTIAMAPGTYSAFAVDGSAPDVLRIISNGMGPVIIDTTAAPITIQGRAAHQVVEFDGLVIGVPGASFAGLAVTNNQGAVIVDSCVIQGGFGQPGVALDDASGVAISRSNMIGTPGLLVDNGSMAAASRGLLDSLEVRGSSELTTCQLVPGTSHVDPGSTVASLSGVMPSLDAEPFFPSGYAAEMKVETFDSGFFFGLYAPFSAWTPVPAIEMPGLLSMIALEMFASGIADPQGFARISVTLPQNSTLIGLPFATQIVGVEPATATLRFSNSQTLVIL